MHNNWAPPNQPPPPPAEQPPPPVAPPKKRHPWLFLLAFFLLVGFIASVINGNSGKPTASPSTTSATVPSPVVQATAVPPPPAVPATDTVIYTVTSDAPTVSVTYTSGAGGEEQSNATPAPFTKTINPPKGSTLYSMLAQMSSTGTRISCSVTVNGTVLSQHTSTGRYAVVICGGAT